MKKYLNLFIWSIFLSTFLVSGCVGETTPGESGLLNESHSTTQEEIIDEGESNTTQEEGVETPQADDRGGSSFAGNPLTFQLRGNVLVLDEPNTTDGASNLYSVSEGNIVPAITASENSETPEAIPQTRNAFFGPNNTAVLLLEEATEISGTTCSLIRLQRDAPDPICIDPTVQTLRTPNSPFHAQLQFDKAGNIYFMTEGALNDWFLNRWEISSNTSSRITPENIVINDFIVSDLGEVFFTDGQDGSRSLGYLNIDANIYTLLLDDVDDFALADSQNVLASTHTGSEYYLSLLPFNNDGWEEVLEWNSPFVFGNPGANFISNTQYTRSYLDFRTAESGDVFALSVSTQSTNMNPILHHVYPDLPYQVETQVAKVDLYHMVGDNLYILGNDSEQRPIFVKRSIDSNSEEIIPLTKDQYTLSLTAVGETIYIINQDDETGNISLEVIEEDGERRIDSNVVLSESARFLRSQGSNDVRNLRNIEIISAPR